MSSVRLEGVVKKFRPQGFSLFSLPREKDSTMIHALDYLYLEIKDGETMGVIGPTGCGKTTLLKVIAGLERVDEGNVYFDNRNVNKLRPRDREIGMVFQNYALYPHMVSRENLAFPFRLRKWPEERIDEKIEFTADTLGVGFRALLGRMPRTLSAGQKQRVALGRCIIRNPKVFLLDEPMSSLDAKLRAKTRTEIKNLLRKFGVTTVYVTHDQSEAVALSHRIAIMRKGKIEQVGSFDEVYNHPVNLFVAEFLGEPSMNLLDVVLKEEKGELFLVGFDSLRVKLPLKWNQTLKEKKLVGEELIFGIRPEHIERRTRTTPPSFLSFWAEVEDKEVSISKAYLSLRVGRHKLMAVTDPHFSPRIGEEIEFSLPVDEGKIFNRENGLAIIS